MCPHASTSGWRACVTAQRHLRIEGFARGRGCEKPILLPLLLVQYLHPMFLLGIVVRFVRVRLPLWGIEQLHVDNQVRVRGIPEGVCRDRERFGRGADGVTEVGINMGLDSRWATNSFPIESTKSPV